jgi:acid phosphatase (class A)
MLGRMVDMGLGKILIVAACIAVNTGCAAIGPQFKPSAVQEEGYVAGYLKSETLPDSGAFIPPPPAEGSTALALDRDISRNSLPLRGSPRWRQAAIDADLTFPKAAGAFSCALNAPLTEEETPHLYILLRRTLADVFLAVHREKDRYMRARPFLVNGEPICTPDDQERLRKSGSYPSGHSAVGWAWALVLSEISPGQSEAIIARGRSFGQSRVICNVHWQSDVIEGRTLGAATFARLHAEPLFRADLESARAELEAVRIKGAKPMRDCEAEAGALAQFPRSAPWPANKSFQGR